MRSMGHLGNGAVGEFAFPRHPRRRGGLPDCCADIQDKDTRMTLISTSPTPGLIDPEAGTDEIRSLLISATA